jgi:hypothetical protein
MYLSSLRLRARSILICFLFAAAGCAPTIKDAARNASQAAVEESVDQLTQERAPPTSADKNPTAGQALTESAMQGMLKTLRTPEAQADLALVMHTLLGTAMQELRQNMRSPETRAALRQLAAEGADAMLAQTTQHIQGDLGKSAAHGIAEAFKTELQPAFAETSRTVFENAVVGVNHGLDDVWSSGGALGDVQDVSHTLMTGLWIGLAILGLIALIVMGLAALAMARARTARAEVARLEDATLLLATAMREQHDTEQTQEILAIVQAALQRDRHEATRLLQALELRRPH